MDKVRGPGTEDPKKLSYGPSSVGRKSFWVNLEMTNGFSM